MGTNEIRITFTFDYEGFVGEFTKRIALRSASDFDIILEEMKLDFKKFIIQYAKEDEWAETLTCRS